MISRILTAMDGGKSSESILAQVEPLMNALRAEVILAMAVPEGKLSLKRSAQSYLESQAKRLRDRGGRVEGAVLIGDPAKSIARLAVDRSCDLIALCTGGKSGLWRMLPGTVDEDILRQVRIPLLVASPHMRTGPAVRGSQRIVVALDGSHRSASILPWVSEIAKAYRAKLSLVTVVSPARKNSLPVHTVCHNLFGEQKDLERRGLEVDLSVLYGDPATEILSYAKNNQSGMIALSTHGRKGLGRLLNGSVTQSILHKFRMSMLVLRTGATVRKPVVTHRGASARHRAMEAFSSSSDRGPYNNG